MKTIKINTNLVGKEECFKKLALATSLQLPLLINGEKGTAKTQAVIDFANSYLEEEVTDSFTIELNEGSRASSLLGMPDMNQLFQNRTFVKDRPIAKSNVVIINEVDKGSTEIRNCLLSVMSEKMIFDGSEKVTCNWKLFVATSNGIPDEEKDNPFWDRLVLRHTMNKLSVSEQIKFMQSDREYKEVMQLNIPNKDEIKALDIDYSSVELMLNLLGDRISNRTAVKLDLIIKATMLINDIDEIQAMREVLYMIEPSLMAEFEKKVLAPEILAFNSAEEMFMSALTKNTGFSVLNSSETALYNALKQIEKNPKLASKVPIYRTKYEKCVDLKENAVPKIKNVTAV